MHFRTLLLLSLLTQLVMVGCTSNPSQIANNTNKVIRNRDQIGRELRNLLDKQDSSLLRQPGKLSAQIREFRSGQSLASGFSSNLDSNRVNRLWSLSTAGSQPMTFLQYASAVKRIDPQSQPSYEGDYLTYVSLWADNKQKQSYSNNLKRAGSTVAGGGGSLVLGHCIYERRKLNSPFRSFYRCN